MIEQLHPATGHDTGGPAAVVRAHAGTVPARVLAAAGLDRCERLLGDVRQLLSTEPPRSGFAMLNDEAQSLRLFVLWPHYDGSQP
ncbi:hypothetical protein [Pseudactinotalea terrae]|uniref:hypothetical protein n=1 Tax=Pseudactinotalea terrae TaxID=1743262 RepID=UPI0012E23C43|nr:hypothetical protein [Pseudactinotalea terrae]